MLSFQLLPNSISKYLFILSLQIVETQNEARKEEQLLFIEYSKIYRNIQLNVLKLINIFQ